MLNYQQLVSEIQSAVYSMGEADAELLRDVAAEYAEACDEVNLRLMRVAKLLREGLRSEAIQLAEEKPNLIDSVTILDMPERSEWLKMLKNWGMALPPPLFVDIAADLNEAYAQEQSLDTLLRSHRLLALARSPLSARIQILRHLHQRDPYNNAWHGDLAAFEQARIKEIKLKSEWAYKQEDMGEIASIHRELHDNQWLIPVPEGLVEQVNRWHQEIGARYARMELEQIAAELNSAFAALDANQGRIAREKWYQECTIAELSPDDPLAEQTAPALEWLEEVDELERAHLHHDNQVKLLVQSLDRDSRREKLERLYHAATLHDAGLPGHVERRYRERIASFDLNSKRKYRIIFISVLTGILVVAGTVYVIISQQRHEQNVAEAVKALQHFIEKGQIAKGQDYFDQLAQSNPRVTRSGPVQVEKGHLDALVAAEKRRQTEFQQAVELAEKAVERVEAGGPLDSTSQSLDRARKLAKSGEELIRLGKLLARHKEVHRIRRKQMEDDFIAKLSEFRAQLVRMDNNPNASNLENSIRELESLEKEIRQWLAIGHQVRPELFNQAKTLPTRAATLRRNREDERKKRIQLAKVNEAVGNLDLFHKALKELADDRLFTSDGNDLTRTITEQPFWVALEEWNEFLANEAFHKPEIMTPEKAANLLQHGDDLLNKMSMLPISKYYENRKAELEHIVARNGSNSIESYLQDLFRDPLIANIHIVVTNDNNRYYLERGAVLNLQSVSENSLLPITYYLDFQLKTRTSSRFKKDDIKYSGISPQSAIAESARLKLGQTNASNWEVMIGSILADIQAKELLDPVLKMVLLKSIIEKVRKGSVIFDNVLQKPSEILAKHDVDLGANWLDPDNEFADEEREKARKVLSNLPNIKQLVDNGIKELGHQDAMPVLYQWIGWLDRDNQGQWQCNRAARIALGNGELSVVVPGVDGNSASLERIGDAKNGQIQLNDKNAPAFLIGRPVYLEYKID